MANNRLQYSRDGQSPRRALNFLLVDDDDICLFIHRRVLELTGYSKSMHTARNGKKAIEFLREAADGSFPIPDLILLDLEMPMMNGIAFLKAFQSLEGLDKSRITIALLSSSLCDEDKQHALALGAVKCLSKPLTEEALHDLIRFIDENKPIPSLVPIDAGKHHKR